METSYKPTTSLRIDNFVDEAAIDAPPEKEPEVPISELNKKFDIKKIVSEFVIKKDAFIFQKQTKLREDYDILNELGKGSYGVVYKAVHKETGETRAIKQIEKAKIKQIQRFRNEVYALKTLDHPNIIKLFEVYEEGDSMYLVQEICKGGELFDRIVENEYLNEKQAASVFQQILQAILYCNKNKISHRDLKPENFMFKSKGESSNLKLIDFGLSMSYFKLPKASEKKGNVKRMKTQVGTAFFMAPEVLSNDYTESCDMWSAGVMLYIML